MTQLGAQTIATLEAPVAAAFQDDEGDFWTACAKQDAQTKNNVTVNGTMRQRVREALEYLDQNAQAALLLGDLLLARPGNADLRQAVGQAFPDALAAVSDERFELEKLIVATLSGAQVVTLRASLDRIDVLQGAVAAYKAMHDALHMLQPHLSLMRGVAAAQARWAEFRVYRDIFNLQLAEIDKATARLAALGLARAADVKQAIADALTSLTTAVDAKIDYDVQDAVSALATSVEDGLNSVDVSMRDTAQDATQPFTLTLQLFAPLAASASGTKFGPLITSYVAFATQLSNELARAIDEHGRWQRLDRQFSLLQRTVVENLPGAPGEIDTVWRLTSKAITALCGGTPPPGWAIAINNLIQLATADLTPPVTPPVADAVRDRVSDLISSGRDRFMAVDQSLLDWLEQSVTQRPQLVTLLRGSA